MNILQLHWYLPNPARNLSGAGLGRISEKWSDTGFAGTGIRYNTINNINFFTTAAELMAVYMHISSQPTSMG